MAGHISEKQRARAAMPKIGRRPLLYLSNGHDGRRLATRAKKDAAVRRATGCRLMPTLAGAPRALRSRGRPHFRRSRQRQGSGAGYYF